METGGEDSQWRDDHQLLLMNDSRSGASNDDEIRKNVLEDWSETVQEKQLTNRLLANWIPLADNRGISTLFISHMTTLQNHWTDTIAVISVPYEASQWRKIYPFNGKTTTTSHCHCIPKVVGWIAYHLPIITRTTIESISTKLNSMKTWQIWIIRTLTQSPSNTTDWQ